jgi:hypothetical protein
MPSECPSFGTEGAGLTQGTSRVRMGVFPTNLGSRRHSPSLKTLRKYARACGKRLEIKIV